MRLTRFGVSAGVFYLVVLGAFFAAPYSNLLFLLLVFLTLLWVNGIVSATRNLHGVEAEIARLDPVPTCSDVRGKAVLSVGDGRRAARYQIDLHLELEGARELVGHVALLSREAELAVTAAPLERGCYAVRRAFLESLYPLGMLRVRRSVEAPAELVVYPAPEALVEGRSARETLEDLIGGGDPGAGDLQPAGLRDHREGEGVRGVHWRASARRGRLVVQEWEGGTGNGLELVLDRRCDEDELEESLAAVSALIEVARTNKETLRLSSQGLAETFGEGHRPWSDALRFLAVAEALPSNGPAPPAVSPGVARLPRRAEGRAA